MISNYIHGFCPVDCGVLSDPPNGHVSRNGLTATYNCSDRYILVGDGTRNCLIDGNWSGSEPICLGMLTLRGYFINKQLFTIL